MICKERNYGALSTVSKNLNCHLLNDCSGQTISRRTTIGFKQITGISICDQNVEHIIHGAMIVSLIAFKKNNPTLGATLLLVLLFSYQAAG